MNKPNLTRPEPLRWTQSPTEPGWDQSEDLAHHPAGSDPIRRYKSCSLNMCSQAGARSPEAAGPEPVLVLWWVGSLGPISRCKQETHSQLPEPQNPVPTAAEKDVLQGDPVRPGTEELNLLTDGSDDTFLHVF